MSMCVLGHAEEFKNHGIAVNALWPRTAIATAAVGNLLGGNAMIKVHQPRPAPSPPLSSPFSRCLFEAPPSED